MVATKLDKSWPALLAPFVKQNLTRPTRLGVFKPDSQGVTDYWIESGLPFIGLDVERRDVDVTVRIMLDKLSHEVNNVANIAIRISVNGDDEGFDVTERDGTVTMLRFEAAAGS